MKKSHQDRGAPQTHPDRLRNISQPKSQPDDRKRALQARKKATKARNGEYMALPDAEAEKRLSNLKKRVRDLSRELSHKNDMPMTLRREKERELDAQVLDLTSALRKKEKNKRITKYHMVRFFERQKATRLLKKAQKTAAAAPADSPQRADLQAAAHEAEVSLNYTMYYPLVEKYVSLWNKEGVGAGFKSDMWHVVEKAMAGNTLQKLRDRVQDDTWSQFDRASGIQKFHTLVAGAKKHRNEDNERIRDAKSEEADSDGDAEADGSNVLSRAGGFFEI